MSLPHRRIKPIRLTAEQEARLRVCAKDRGQTQQAFALAAIFREVVEVEAERVLRNKKEPSREARGHRRIEQPVGFGIIQPREKPQPAAGAAPPGAFIIQAAHPAGQVKEELVARMADHVVAGRAYDRDRRLRTAIECVRAFAKGDDERRELAGALDAAVAERTKERPAGGFAGVLSFANETFDRLKQQG